MRRIEALILLVAAYAAVTAALTWEFGPYGLGGAGTAALAVLGFIDVKEE